MAVDQRVFGGADRSDDRLRVMRLSHEDGRRYWLFEAEEGNSRSSLVTLLPESEVRELRAWLDGVLGPDPIAGGSG